MTSFILIEIFSIVIFFIKEFLTVFFEMNREAKSMKAIVQYFLVVLLIMLCTWL